LILGPHLLHEDHIGGVRVYPRLHPPAVGGAHAIDINCGNTQHASIQPHHTGGSGTTGGEMAHTSAGAPRASHHSERARADFFGSTHRGHNGRCDRVNVSAPRVLRANANVHLNFRIPPFSSSSAQVTTDVALLCAPTHYRFRKDPCRTVSPSPCVPPLFSPRGR